MFQSFRPLSGIGRYQMPRMATPFLRPVRAPRGLRPLPPSPLPIRMAASQSAQSTYSLVSPPPTVIDSKSVGSKTNVFGIIHKILPPRMGPGDAEDVSRLGSVYDEEFPGSTQAAWSKLLREIKQTPYPTKEQKRRFLESCKFLFGKDDNFFQVRKILEPLHDYSGLRRLVELYMQRY